MAGGRGSVLMGEPAADLPADHGTLRYRARPAEQDIEPREAAVAGQR
jgi:hypothetical protein